MIYAKNILVILFSRCAEAKYFNDYICRCRGGAYHSFESQKNDTKKTIKGECKQIPLETPILVRHAPLRAQCRREHYFKTVPSARCALCARRSRKGIFKGTIERKRNLPLNCFLWLLSFATRKRVTPTPAGVKI